MSTAAEANELYKDASGEGSADAFILDADSLFLNWNAGLFLVWVLVLVVVNILVGRRRRCLEAECTKRGVLLVADTTKND